jgi:hypothetical protein
MASLLGRLDGADEGGRTDLLDFDGDAGPGAERH